MMDRFSPDIVHVHNAYPSLGPAVVLAASERNIPVVMTVHNFRLRCPNGFMFTEGAVCHRCESGGLRECRRPIGASPQESRQGRTQPSSGRIASS